ncbi:glycosyl hydrolase [Duganella sp. FT92W]|uniref:Glycosyl hydrolase n=1 Tax=Pseudoduganella rivuli TaxID=2666085 RepID=A0A7X2LWU8_9BURK|nr:glycosyl hydrolase [Pseudoduganella rivuli]MRV76383.1 glycosyl hydrolase [Pseudoduganella rivuli]
MRSISTLLLLAALAPQAHAAEFPAFVYSPYKHLAMWNDPANNVITAAPNGVKTPYIADGALPFGKQPLTWAFASGECGDEHWGGQPAQAVADANVPSFAKAGIGYIISTGGQGNVFTCATDDGMERFIRRYESPQLIGFDFDIEAEQTPEQIASLADRIAVAQKLRPHLRMSFTVPTLAASDGSRISLNPTAEAVLAAVRKAGIQNYALNLMVMDYGPAAKKACVVHKVRGKARCDMGASALQAARNVHAKYGVPYEQIELTAMIGVNDVVENVFTLRDAQAVAQGVLRMKLAGLHYWSLDRDTPCGKPVKGADATCSTMPGVPAGAYLRAMARTLGQVAQ